MQIALASMPNCHPAVAASPQRRVIIGTQKKHRTSVLGGLARCPGSSIGGSPRDEKATQPPIMDPCGVPNLCSVPTRGRPGSVIAFGARLVAHNYL
jgi:hypothetical protein